MRALFIEHDHVSPPGFVGERLHQRGYEIVEQLIVPEERFHAPGVTAEYPDPREFDVIVPMGAPWAAYDHDLVGSWVLPELDFLREADAAQVPVLGICFGGQLLALAHGGTVAKGPAPEFGWVDIETDEPDVVATGPWFQWHFDRWTLPPGALELARSTVASQAFTLRRNFAVQFHPELKAASLKGWLDNGGHAQLLKHDLDPQAVYDEMVAEEPAARERTYRLVDAFLQRCALKR